MKIEIEVSDDEFGELETAATRFGQTLPDYVHTIILGRSRVNPLQRRILYRVQELRMCDADIAEELGMTLTYVKSIRLALGLSANRRYARL